MAELERCHARVDGRNAHRDGFCEGLYDARTTHERRERPLAISFEDHLQSGTRDVMNRQTHLRSGHHASATAYTGRVYANATPSGCSWNMCDDTGHTGLFQSRYARRKGGKGRAAPHPIRAHARFELRRNTRKQRRLGQVRWHGYLQHRARISGHPLDGPVRQSFH